MRAFWSFLHYNGSKEKPEIAICSEGHTIQLENHLVCAHSDESQNKISNTQNLKCKVNAC